jgi:hypothetical protein
MNKYDVEYERIVRKMERGGSIESYAFEMQTPTGKKSKLTYVQQLLVRTTSFKEWFGDWEKAAEKYVGSGKHTQVLSALDVMKDVLKERVGNADESIYDYQNLIIDSPFLTFDYQDEIYYAYKNVSKVLDIETLEPRVVYHGTNSAEEFYTFRTETRNTGRPYAYFAYNREYSENFAKQSNVLYECFLNVRDPYINIVFTHHAPFEWQVKQIIGDLKTKADRLGYSIENEKRRKIEEYIKFAVENIIYAQDPDVEKPFWYLLSTDVQGILKEAFELNGYDGVMFAEELMNLVSDLDYFRKELFTRAVVVFNPNQIKLADGRNVDFFSSSNDIRYAEGGNLEKEIMLPDTTSKYAHLKGILKMQGYDIYPSVMAEKFEVGGTVKHEKGATTDGKKGGYFEGRSHADGGIKAFNVSTNTPIEVEGGEVIITKKAVDDDDLKEFEGEMLTNREILSRINQSGGGVAFEDGGEIHSCGCNGNKFAYGGETLEDYEIIRRLQSSYETKENMKNSKTQYGHNLMRKMKQGGFI